MPQIRSGQLKNDDIQIEDLKDFAVQAGSGLNATVLAGRIRNDNAVTDKSNQSVSVTDNTTNYVEIDTAGIANVSTSGFTSGNIPLATVVTASGAITVITDKRTWVAVGGTTAPTAGINFSGTFFLMGA